MPDTIPTDVSETNGALSFDDAVDALTNLGGGEDLPEEEDEGDGDDQDETPDDADEDGEDDGDEDEADPDDETDNDDDEDGDGEDDAADADGAASAEVEVVVDGKTHKVSVDDLKRLYGQEASLTRKSQEVADLRKVAQAQEQKYATAMGSLIEKAQEAWKPYADIDWLVAPQNMDADDFKALRSEAKKAYENLAFLTTENETFMQEKAQEWQATNQAQVQEAAKAAHETLSDPEKGIPGWSADVYNGIRSFAQSEGMPVEAINSIIDPVALKILWKASQFSKGKKIATQKTAKSAAKKVQRSKGKSSSGKTTKGLAKLQQTGSFEDAVSALMEL